MNSKILVTGGNGYIGSQIIKLYFKKGIKTDSLGRGENKNKIVSKYFQVDITDYNNLRRFKNNYDLIIHCAGSPNVSRSVKLPIFDFNINLLGTLNMLEFARKNNSKFILLSTVSVFSTENELPLTENSKKKVSSPYGASKLSAESYCNAYFRSYGLDIRIARIFNTYGPGMKHLFISDMIKKIKTAKELVTIGGTGNQVRDYVFIDDLVQAISLIISDGEPGEDYNICSGRKVTLYQLTNLLIDKLNKKNIKINCDQISYPGDIEKWYGNPKKIKKLGFIQKVKLETGIERTINN